ncbi:hypothetical protein G6F57_003978 [Rhizopus arrhizus]|nr:hypothetical protein G6F30_006130 [Rhizopus arrhizus]KAG1424537.1 hypothetical protein G6F58_002324 [Rhizopus delemar]KAG0985724.1 hypothetical protein G6F29_003795 [Rhizopus arrhizus]KAG0993475.1 hypothetical protein G6F28_006653 [Rhizopus arrhizus]KAG1011239.1 hypothetical protein G6F27_003912 [Rhizopus arrhizus]
MVLSDNKKCERTKKLKKVCIVDKEDRGKENIHPSKNGIFKSLQTNGSMNNINNNIVCINRGQKRKSTESVTNNKEKKSKQTSFRQNKPTKESITGKDKEEIMLERKHKDRNEKKEKKKDEATAYEEQEDDNFSICMPLMKRNKSECEENIEQISQRLKDNMIRVTYNLLEGLIQSNRPHDLLIYEKIFSSHQQTISIRAPEKKLNHSINNIDAVVDTSISYIKEESPNKNDNPLLQINPNNVLKNLSFNTEQENDFITTWFQCHDYEDNTRTLANIHSQDSFNTITNQELSASLAEDSKPRTVDVEKRESNNKINESKRPCNVRQFSAFPSKESKKHYVPSLNNTRKRDKSPANDDNPDDGAEWTLISKKREKKRYQSFPPTNTPTKTFSCSFSSSENVERSGKLINANNLAYIADGTTSKTGPITVIPRQTWASPTEQYEYSPSLSNNDSCSTVSSTKSPTTSHLELFLQMTEKYYSPFITGFDLGVAPAQISINDFMFYDSRKLDHHLLSQARFHKNESPETDKSYLISPYLDEVDMVHEPSIVNFLNQVDSEDTAFFSKRLETKYKIFIS